VFFLVIVGAGFLSERLVSRRAGAEFDAALLARARALAALTEQEEQRVEFDYESARMPEFEREERPDYFQFWLEDGRAIERSARLRGAGGLPRDPATSPEPRFRDAALPDGRAGRIVQFAFTPRFPGEADRKAHGKPGPEDGAAPPLRLVLALARGRETLDALVRDMRLSILGVHAAALLVGAALVAWTLASGLRPIGSIAARLRELDAENLDRDPRLPTVPEELRPMADQIRALVARLAASFERERRFAANVAHELRTPIAELRSLADVAGRWPDDAEAVSRFFGDAREVAGRMERLVSGLLLLSRCQSGLERAERRAVPLLGLVESAWAGLRDDAKRRGIRLALSVPADLSLETDPDKLRMILRNLLDNAVSYSAGAGDVGCAAAIDGGRLRLHVTNRAEPLAPDEMARLTEPFWRRDPSRASADHAGLGLPLCAALAPLLALELSFAQDGEGRFRATLEARDFPK